MGWKIWQQSEKKLLDFYATLRDPFQVLTITLLSLLLPLSFLLLARLSTAHYLLAFTAYSTPPQSSLIFSLLLNTYPFLLHGLVSIVSVTTFVHCSTGRLTPITELPALMLRPGLYTAWILLCTLQVCVGLGIEGTIAAGIDGSDFGQERSLLGRVIFFLGLHETMLYWSRTVVKRVVDDTVFGFAREERWVERVAMGASFGVLWWWRLRGEVESLVVVAEVKRELLMGVGVADFVSWWLYYLTVMIGMVRLVKGLIWLGMIFLCRRVEGSLGDPRPNVDEKV
ncbi:unnamed protein product [Ilex paraguariensis]|uniref:Transmembrane protein n=1 Tax=Ilex paraguariensis TaxID=185542 RepID=A0ABC8S6R1_9AQUA